MNKQFKEWLTLKEYDPDTFTDSFLFPFPMRWGVYLEFFDSAGINLYLNPCGCHKPAIYNPCVISNSLELFEDLGEFETLQAAQQEAINKAFEILNNKL